MLEQTKRIPVALEICSFSSKRVCHTGITFKVYGSFFVVKPKFPPFLSGNIGLEA